MTDTVAIDAAVRTCTTPRQRAEYRRVFRVLERAGHTITPHQLYDDDVEAVRADIAKTTIAQGGRS